MKGGTLLQIVEENINMKIVNILKFLEFMWMANAPTPGQRWMANALPLGHRKVVNPPPYPGGGTLGDSLDTSIMETVAKEYGHEILRLFPYHCELNPNELAWAAEKNYITGENKDMSLDSVEKLFRKKKEKLPDNFWRKCVEHVEKIEENYWESDRIQDNKVEQLIIKLKPTDSSSSGMESFSESSDSSDSDQS